MAKVINVIPEDGNTTKRLDSKWTCETIDPASVIASSNKEASEKKTITTRKRTVVTPNGTKETISYEVKPKEEYVTGRALFDALQQDVVIKIGPDSGSAEATFKLNLPSGAVIKSATVWVTPTIGEGGSSILTANGVFQSKTNLNQIGFDIPIDPNAREVVVKFVYKSGGKLYEDEVEHTATTILNNVYIQVEYDIPTSGIAEAVKTGYGYSSPPQSVCIYDQTDGAIYTFDGVTKVQHNMTTDIQEEPDKPKLYVNNAKNEPDKLTIDVLMSDVYSGGTDITMDGFMTSEQSQAISRTRNAVVHSGETRSQIFFYAIHWLKEQRRKITVITPQFVHVDMIIASITVNHDDMTPFGWEGQIAFQHAFAAKPKATATKKTTPTNTDEVPTAGFEAQILNSVKDGNVKDVVDQTNKVIKQLSGG